MKKTIAQPEPQQRWFVYRRPTDESLPLECYVVRFLRGTKWREKRLPRDKVRD